MSCFSYSSIKCCDDSSTHAVVMARGGSRSSSTRRSTNCTSPPPERQPIRSRSVSDHLECRLPCKKEARGGSRSSSTRRSANCTPPTERQPTRSLFVSDDLECTFPYTKEARGGSKSSSTRRSANCTPPPPERQPTRSLPVSDDLECRFPYTKEVLWALQDETINLISINCGKMRPEDTVSKKEFIGRVKQQDLFEQVLVIIALSINPDMRRMQDEIADMLQLELEKHGTLLERAKLLRARLICKDSRRVLVILVGVRDMPDLEAIGIPYGDTMGQCKIMFMSSAGHLMKRAPSKKIVPISSPTVGRSARHEIKRRWDDALRELREASPGHIIPGMIHEVYRGIGLSYECLGSEEAKQFFLMCCILWKGSDMEVADLVRCGTGVGLFKGIGCKREAWRCVEALVDIIKGCCLLLDGEKEDCVKMHDLAHNVGLSIAASKGWMN